LKRTIFHCHTCGEARDGAEVAIPTCCQAPMVPSIAVEMADLVRIVEELQPPSLCAVFLLRCVGRMPSQVIAERLHMTVGAVDRDLTRAFAHCHERLANQ
jgi:DNA-directed RNA polymerase specialized sigma24 family protein